MNATLEIAVTNKHVGENTASEESISPQPSQSQVDAMRVKDRQNVIILIHEFLENTVSVPTDSRVSYSRRFPGVFLPTAIFNSTCSLLNYHATLLKRLLTSVLDTSRATTTSEGEALSAVQTIGMSLRSLRTKIAQEGPP